jgi:hypothetical protein
VFLLWLRDVGPTEHGWGWTMATLLVFSGTQLLLLGLIGEYQAHVSDDQPAAAVVVRDVVTNTNTPMFEPTARHCCRAPSFYGDGAAQQVCHRAADDFVGRRGGRLSCAGRADLDRCAAQCRDAAGRHGPVGDSTSMPDSGKVFASFTRCAPAWSSSASRPSWWRRCCID